VRSIGKRPPQERSSSSRTTAECAVVPQTSGPIRVYLWKHPTFTSLVLFLLILSGPPRLRIRDPEASLHGEIDWVVLLHLAVWGAAGLWILWQMAKRFQAKRPLLRMRLAQILGLALIFCLAASTFVSVAPALTAFKVYQILVSMLFTQLFVKRFGVRASLNAMLWGNALLCLAIAICAFLAPDMVWAPSDFNPDPTRLFGTLIAPTGVVAVLAITLLLTSARKIWRPLPLSLLVLFIGLLALSLMRTAYVAAFVFFVLVLFKRPDVKPLRRFAYSLCGLLLMSYACGWLPSLSQYRDPQSISTLSDRTGLWRHLTDVTLSLSPWFGLGYYSASRTLGLEYNPGLGTAHSAFFEVLSGGGIVSFVLFVALCLTLSIYAVRLLFAGKDRLLFATSSLFIVSLVFASMVDEIDSGPIAISFWCAAAILPRLYESVLKRTPQRAESGDYLTARAWSGV
jgi:hypothetical protein